MEDTARNHQLASLRLLVDLWLDNPALPIPFWVNDARQIGYVWSEEDQKAAAKDLVPFSKVYTDAFFDIERVIGNITYVVRTGRDTTCEATVVGTKTVRKNVCITPSVYEMQDVEEDVIEWDCPESLLG